MLRHVEPSAFDDEPLLAGIDDEEEVSYYKSPDRRRRHSHCYRSTSRAIILRHDDLLVKIREEDDEEEPDEKRAVSTVVQYGPCGLAACKSSFWRAFSVALRCVYAYYFFNWTIIFAGLSLCTTVSLVYDAWLTASSLGQAAVVMAMLPTLNLLWILMSFVWHVLLWGCFNDFHDLESSLQGIRYRTQQQFIRNLLTFGVAILVNVPVGFSFIVFCYQIKKPAAEWIWQSQFWLSFVCNVLLAILFFTGATLGQDHTEDPEQPPPLPPSLLCRCLHPIWYLTHGALTSDTFRAMRVYFRSAFTDFGPFNEAGTNFGRHASDYVPEPVDLEERAPEHYKHLGVRASKYNKKWPTPWYLGWYIKCYLVETWGFSPALDQGRCFHFMVHLPWSLVLLTTLIILSYIAWSVKAYVLFAFVTGYFLLLPLFYAAVRRAVTNIVSGRLVLDIFLILIMLSGFFISLGVSCYYLGPSIIAIVLLANTATLLAHIPAIRDREYPPPKDHREGLAFHTKAMTHTITSTARTWAFVSILFVLALVLAMRTVPQTGGGGKVGPKAIRSSSSLHHHRHHYVNGSSDGLTTATGSSGTLTIIRGAIRQQQRQDGDKEEEEEEEENQPYPFCTATYAHLSILELAHISNAAYMELDEAKAYVDEYIPHKDFQVTFLDLAKEYGVAYGPITYQLKDIKSKILVFAVRGTNEVFDLYQDLDVWMEAMVIQGASYIFPLYGSPIFQPFMEKFVGTSHHLVQALSSLKDVILNRQGTGLASGAKQRYYYDLLYNFLVDQVLTDPSVENYKIVMTGHSLGGGVSQVVGARLKTLAVTFSAPGVVLSRRKFGITMDEIDEYLVNLQPQGDLVPLLDIQGVKAQSIRCKADALAYHCHSLLNTIDEITDGCPNLAAAASMSEAPPSPSIQG